MQIANTISMTHNVIRKKYIDFFKMSPRNHKEIPSSSLVPENDPTTLFTSSGMQPLVPYLLGEKHPVGIRIVNSQKCFRAQDIDEVGDNRHTTFFEMLGNWSLGDYFKKEQLEWFFEFLTNELKLDPKKLFVTVFEGNESVPKDHESITIWKEIFDKSGIKAEEGDYTKGIIDNSRIFPYSSQKNWWSRSGEPSKMPEGEPGGPDSEVFFDFGQERKFHENSLWKNLPCHPNCDCGRFLEIGNSVFMQYQKQKNGSLKELPSKNVDFGGGLERLVAVTENQPDLFKTSLFNQLISLIESETNFKYGENVEITRAIRIVTDHIRAAVMIMADGAIPSNKLQGSILRKLISRIITNADQILKIKSKFINKIAYEVINTYETIYPLTIEKKKTILSLLNQEEQRLKTSILQGIKKVNQDTSYLQNPEKSRELIIKNLAQYNIDMNEFEQKLGGFKSLATVASGITSFITQTSYGTPIEYSKPLLKPYIENESEYNKVLENINIFHKNLSKTTSAKMFKGGLQDQSHETTKLHTATHLLQQSLRTVLGNHVRQKGSHITAERLRFDFIHPTKLTDEEIKKIESLVNDEITQNLKIDMKIASLKIATEDGALTVPGANYPDEVKVYSIGNFSKEVCGGPHVDFTGKLGSFKIVKEEGVSSGVRRIYAQLFGNHVDSQQNHAQKRP